MDDKTFDSKLRELVIARLRSAPPNMGIAIGNQETFTPAQLISEIEHHTEQGNDYLKLELEFLQALKEGRLYGQNSSVH